MFRHLDILSVLQYNAVHDTPLHSPDIKHWERVRSQFCLPNDWIHVAQTFLSACPQKVQNAIDYYRKQLDDSFAHYVKANCAINNRNVAEAAANYLQCEADEIALTDSATMGLGLLHFGLKLNAGDEVLATSHCNCSTSLELIVKRSKARLRKIDLYQDPATARIGEMTENLINAVRPETRFVLITYVQSATGVKLPVRQIAAGIKKLNASRAPSGRIYLCVDAVHALGVENFTMEELGCDFLTAGTHKWLFGPRGTGILFGRKDAWDVLDPMVIPFSFTAETEGVGLPKGDSFFSKFTPDSYFAAEYRWALKEAFEYHLEIGKEKIQNRTHYLNSLLKAGLLDIPHIQVHTPFSNALSAGIVCFEVKGMDARMVIQKLKEARIIGTTAPQSNAYACLTPSILNSEAEIFKCIETLEKIFD
ncbi:MAG: aminotransferase class V-fold PLP-dependent enzyme [Saprospiraceae bacterium]|nr:aminotransferase class V-fold PLP-dependent enzyme [Lewinellaceae bacterium]